MGVQPTRLKTQAEMQLAEQFAGLGAVSPGQADAFKRFEAQGLPHRRVEAYHFTDLRASLREALPPAAKPDAAAIRAAHLRLGVPHAPCRIVLLDGHFIAELSSSAPDGVQFGVNLGSHLAGFPDDAMLDLVAAFGPHGVAIKVADGVAVGGAIELLHLHSLGEPRAIFAQDFVQVGDGASLTLLETHAGQGDSDHRHTMQTLVLGAGASVAHVSTAAPGTGFCVHSQQVRLGAKASFESFALLAGGKLTRRQIFLKFTGEHATASLNGVSLLRGNEHIDTTLTVDHAAPHCNSRETFRHIIDGEATGVFQGKIIVRPGAQKTDGKMMSKAVLLSESGIMNNKPELEIFADDVVCGHGATVGALDEDQLFYAQQRGIPKQEAQALLLEAFAGEVIDTISHEETAARLRDIVAQWLTERKA